MTRACTMTGCTRPLIARGLCPTHYKRWQVHGDPAFKLPPSPPPRAKAKPVAERISRSVVVDENGCWIWQKHLGRHGYGHLVVGGKSWLAHRASYTAGKGEIAAGLTLDHLCRVRACVNPAHLEPVSAAENTLRGEGPSARNARKTHCVNGHPFVGDNFRVYGRMRCCMVCTQVRNARRVEQGRERRA